MTNVMAGMKNILKDEHCHNGKWFDENGDGALLIQGELLIADKLMSKSISLL